MNTSHRIFYALFFVGFFIKCKKKKFCYDLSFHSQNNKVGRFCIINSQLYHDFTSCFGFWKVYMLKLNNGSFYIGITNNLFNRIKKHASGKGSKYVRSHLPFVLVYYESVLSKGWALKREYALKKLSHIKKLKLAKEFENV